MTSYRRKVLTSVALLSSGVLFQVFPTSCAQTLAIQATAALDFCAILNCTGGSFFNLCAPVRLLIDCPGGGDTTP